MAGVPVCDMHTHWQLFFAAVGTTTDTNATPATNRADTKSKSSMAAASKSITTPPSVPPPLPLVPARPAPTPPPTPQHPSAETINVRFQLNRTIPHCGAVEMGWLMLCCCTCLTVGRNLCGGSWRVSDFGVYLEWLFQLYNEMIVDGDATRRNLPLFVDAFFTTAPVRGCLLHNGTGAHFRRSRLDAARALPFTFTGTSSSGASSGPRRAFRSGEIRFPERNWHTPFLGTSTLRRESKGSG
jgi:hypothetical protein